MARKGRMFEDQVVVITGASSGIGRVAARMFAEEGAAVVLAARREPALHEVAEEVVRAGGRAMNVPTDVRDEGHVRRLAQRAVDAFGGIDVWINNAGLASFGKFEDTPPDAVAAVMDTTFFGVVHGFRAVLPVMRDQGHGTIITTASIAGRVPTPYHAAYGAAKHAVLGFSESVQQELVQDGFTDIHVCNILPGPIDTPFWQHAANYSGRKVQAMQPARSPESVAAAMLKVARSPKREVGVGIPPWALELGMAVAQGPLERLMGKSSARNLFGPAFAPKTSGSLHRPMPEFTGATGGWRGQNDNQSDQGAGGMAGLGGLLALAVPLGAAALYRYQKHGRVF